MGSPIFFLLLVEWVAPALMAPFHRGMCWGHGKTAFYNRLENYSSAAANASLAALLATGVSHIQIETAWYLDSCNSTTLRPRSYTPSDASVISAIVRSRALGMTTLLNAHIEVACKYDDSCPKSCGGRNNIDFGSDTAKWDAWFSSYTEFIVHYAKLCDGTEGCDALAVHVELQEIGLQSLTHDSLTRRWQAVIAAVRAVYRGKLTASCNGSPGITAAMALNISYWEQLDYIGIDTFPNVKGNPVAATDVKIAFDTILANLAPLVARTGKKVLFTQVGYPSCENCGLKSASFKYPAVDETCQANAYLGILQSLMAAGARHLVAGIYFWNWLPCVEAAGKACPIGSKDNGESPQGKEAASVVKRFYHSSSSGNNAFV